MGVAPFLFSAALAGLLGLAAAGCGSGSDSGVADPPRPRPAAGVLHGPGAHWIDFVEAGTVGFTASAEVGLDLDEDGAVDSTLGLAGTTTVHRSAAQVATPGTGLGHRGRLELEIVTMELRAEGVTLRAGDGVANLRPDGPLFSIGTSDERADDPALATDAFAVAFEVEFAGRTLRAARPLTVDATIDRLPPLGSVFSFGGDPLDLVDIAGQATGIRVVTVAFRPVEMTAPSAP